MVGLMGRIAALGDVAKVGIGPFVPLCKVSFLCIGDVVGPKSLAPISAKICWEGGAS